MYCNPQMPLGLSLLLLPSAQEGKGLKLTLIWSKCVSCWHSMVGRYFTGLSICSRFGRLFQLIRLIQISLILVDKLKKQLNRISRVF